MKKKIVSVALSAAMAASAVPVMQTAVSAETWSANTTGTPQYMETKRQMESLDRGLIAVKTETNANNGITGGVYLSWRLLGDESLENQAFDIYRGTSANGAYSKIHTTGAHDATNYTDTTGTATNYYKVVKAGTSVVDVLNAEATPVWTTNRTARGSYVGNGTSEPNSFNYIDIPISCPISVSRAGDGKTSYYYSYDSDHEGGANDASVGDLDGDGDYEIVLKWDPTDSKDSAGSDFTGNTFIDAYQIDPNNTGYMWRVDLGPNITSGQHYEPYLVYDFDGDGRSEVVMSTAPGSYAITSSGEIKYVTEVGDTAEIRNADNSAINIGMSGRPKGKNLGPAYYTIFDGETGEPLCTTDAIPLGDVSSWGDSKYNRSERYLAAVAYLDGIHPSIIECRGYYNKAVIRAYTFDGSALDMTWEHWGTENSASTMYGQGNHNLSVADVDNDGKDEIVYGSAVLDDDGQTVLGNTRMGHGDAMHVNDFNNDGVQEVFSVKEDTYKTNGANFRVAGTGETIWTKGASADNGRGVMDNIDDAYALANPETGLALGWSAAHANTIDLAGNEVNTKPATSSRSMTNFLVYWDGDLGREILDDNQLTKYYADTGYTVRFYDDGNGYIPGTSNNYSKQTPSLVADIWGDWREEIIMPINKDDPTGATQALRIFTSTLPTEYRLTTLMHDAQYRCAIAWQNVGYNQPPHTSYYIGSAALAKDTSGNTMNYLAPATLYTNVAYELDKVSVTGISLSDDSISVEKGDTVNITADIEPDNATRKGIIWSSSDTSVATVSGGSVTGVAPGTATITATTRDGGFTASCEVEVWSIPVKSVTMSGDITLGVGNNKTIIANVLPEDASDKSLVWRSTNDAIATVDEDGVVTGVAPGTVLIIAQSEESKAYASCMVNVTPLTATDSTGSDVFKTDNTDAETVLSNATATSASFKQTDAQVGGNFYRTFDKITENKGVLKFHFTTGGQRIDGSNWNWDGHEYTFYVSLLGENDQNILTLSQAYRSSGQSLMSKAGNSAEGAVANNWTAVVDSIGQVQGSAKRWVVEVEFDYDNDSAKATLTGTDSTWETVAAQYTYEFELNGLSLEKLEYRTTKDGDGGITVSPSLADLSYQSVISVDGATNLIYEKGTSADTAWTTDDLSDWVQTNTDTAALQLDTTASANGRIYYGPEKPGASYSAAKTFDISDNALVTYSADWHFGSATNRFTNFEYIQFGSNLRLGWTSKGGYYYVLASTDGGTSYIGHTGEDAVEAVTADQAVFAGSNETYTKNVQVTYNTATNTLVSLKFDGAEVSMLSNYIMPEGTTMDSVSFGFQRGGSTESWAYPNGLESLMVSEFIEGAEPVRPDLPSDLETPEPVKELTVGTPTVSDTWVTVEVTNTLDDAQDVRLIVASYDENGVLAGISLSETGEVGVNDTVTLEAEAPVTGVYKVMVWDNTNDMAPLIDLISVSE